MARIGKRILEVPKGVEVKFNAGILSVKGPKGTLTREIAAEVKVLIEAGKVSLTCEKNDPKFLALHGLFNSLIKNMLDGVTKGFEKELEMVGVGYRAQMQGKKLQLSAGFSHPIEIEPPVGIDFEVIGGTKIKIKGADRQKVGQIAAEIRDIREVEPYKGKGIKYTGETVRRKAGKAAKTGAGAGAA